MAEHSSELFNFFYYYFKQWSLWVNYTSSAKLFVFMVFFIDYTQRFRAHLSDESLTSALAMLVGKSSRDERQREILRLNGACVN